MRSRVGAARGCGPRRGGALLRAAAPGPSAGDGTRAQHPARHARHLARRPARRYGYARGQDAVIWTGWRAKACGSNGRSVPRPSRCRPTRSILTGLYPFEHGVRNNGNFYLSRSIRDARHRAHAANGYRTAAFVSSFVLDRRYGLARGFESYDDRMQGAQSQVVSLEAERRGDRTALALSRWLAVGAERRPADRARAVRRFSSGCTSTIRTSRIARRRLSATGVRRLAL